MPIVHRLNLQNGTLLMTFFEPQMYARRLQVLSLAIGITAIAACSGDGNRSRGFSGTEPNSRQFNITESLATVSFAEGDTLSLAEN